MYVVQRQRGRPTQRRMYSPIERGVVSSVGVGPNGLEGLDGIDIGKMFKRLVTITPNSFKLKNIMGAIGSLATTTATMGLAPLIAPKLVSAHSKTMQHVGMGVTAAAVVAGGAYAAGAMMPAATGAGLSTAGTAVGTASSGSSTIGTALATSATGTTGGGIFSTIGSGISWAGGQLWTGIKAIGSVLPMVGQVLGSGGGGQVQYATQDDAYAQQYAMQQQQAAQAEYDRQYAEYMKQQQEALYTPGMAYGQGLQYPGQAQAMNASYGDLRSPYMGVDESGNQVMIDPATGQPISGWPLGLSLEVWIGIATVSLIGGWWVMKD